MTGYEWRPGLLVEDNNIKNWFDRILVPTAPIFSAPLIDYYLLPSLVVLYHCIVRSHHARDRAFGQRPIETPSQAHQANRRLGRAQHYALLYCCGVMTSQVSVIDCAAKSIGIMPGRTGEFRYCKALRLMAQLLIDMPFDERSGTGTSATTLPRLSMRSLYDRSPLAISETRLLKRTCSIS
jgi:hypothetical protein